MSEKRNTFLTIPYLPVPGVAVFCTPTSLESSLESEQGTTLVRKVQHIRFPEVTEDKTDSLREATPAGAEHMVSVSGCAILSDELDQNVKVRILQT